MTLNIYAHLLPGQQEERRSVFDAALRAALRLLGTNPVPFMRSVRKKLSYRYQRRMGGRVVEGTGLENRQTRKRLEGSNPSPSASFRNNLLISRNNN